MTTERAIRFFAGTVVLVSLALGMAGSAAFVSANWLTAFVGASLLQSSFTGFCPLEKILLRLGMRSSEHAA